MFAGYAGYASANTEISKRNIKKLISSIKRNNEVL